MIKNLWFQFFLDVAVYACHIQYLCGYSVRSLFKDFTLLHIDRTRFREDIIERFNRESNHSPSLIVKFGFYCFISFPI
jgi:hypothetical protein